MSGIVGKSGRKRRPGKVYQFTFFYRFLPGEDPPELAEMLEAITQARGRKRQDIIRAALLGGSGQAQAAAAQVEDSESSALFTEMLDDF
ncbi:MAG: hypothetical protein BroJett011_39460 [Chloroflexota bacterium]|nr:MAG: hypothetical protein BroJett011_39460 [Chloroflexota bacterium]